MTSLAIAAVVQASLLAATPTATPSDYSRAYQQSLTTGRPLVVLIGADWCPGCVVMKNRTIPEVARAGGLANVEFAYVDVDRQRKLAGQLARGQSIPQLIRFCPSERGWQSQVLTGAHPVEEVARFVKACPKRNLFRFGAYQKPQAE
jgi:thioredoxin-like negative regulator of GroEL